jgi:hypothetical protein
VLGELRSGRDELWKLSLVEGLAELVTVCAAQAAAVLQVSLQLVCALAINMYADKGNVHRQRPSRATDASLQVNGHIEPKWLHGGCLAPRKMLGSWSVVGYLGGDL